MTDKFLSTPSARRATTCCRCGAACGAYFYPRPPRGGRRSAAGLEGQAGRFLSTPSARRATPMSRSICARRSKFLSTPSARRATLLSTARVLWISISIHALREEGDLLAEIVKPVELISIHALREEGDAFWLQRPCWVLLFLSTPSARRATLTAWWPLLTGTYFYPRPPRGGRRCRIRI